MDLTLQTILATRRCHQSTGELSFVAALHKKIKSLGYEPVAKAMGNVTAVVAPKGKTKLAVNVMFSCHVDTVHSMLESDGKTQKLVYDPNKGHIFLAEPDDATCLGADDGAGIYIMIKMMEAGVPGTYVFHRGEEKGCIGSREMLVKEPEWLKQFDACIAFDRPGTNEVIATQSGQPCASVEYAKSLADALNTAEPTFKYEVSHRGVVTDSKMYAPVISECINIGVGYFGQHGNGEYQDWKHLEKLTAAVCKINWQALKPSRSPIPAQKPIPRYTGPKYGLFEDLDDLRLTTTPTLKPVAKAPPAPELSFQAEVEASFSYEELAELMSDEGALVVIGLRAELAAANARARELATHFGLEVTW